ncbi:GNAT family N-acetyltransferase [Komarekiella sp. 'clone 1']|uniref:GNAT family N-acetyltransferase n=1 Tax=Komarekiella delphini-convector SJRDD-AB1 TaxID=2593771 RepID=A0AA40VTH6_9NOST|nr:GNAT family N-acetyltransferase [Komarekiella delphini-convector]MBD6619212.1 GNAT family N-acetyltransferase [Komarekiella delphini-convector SJRDD-AB1]
MIKLIAPERIIETSRLLLEPLVPAHASVIYEQLLDKRLYQFIPQSPPISLQTVESRYLALSSRLSPDGQEGWLNWVIRFRESGVYIGTLQATVHANCTAAIAYTIFPLFWRQGYAKEGCSRVLEHLFEEYRVSFVTVDIDTRNIASIRLVEALGMKRTFTRTNADFFKGSVNDEYRYEAVSPFTPLSGSVVE